MTPSPHRPRFSPARRGFLLLEVILALGVFGVAATGFTVALKRMGEAATLVQREAELTRILENALQETLSLPTLEEGVTSMLVPGTDIEIDTRVLLLEELESEEGQLLQEMFQIQVTGYWFDGQAWQERTMETWRYGRLYQP